MLKQYNIFNIFVKYFFIFYILYELMKLPYLRYDSGINLEKEDSVFFQIFR
jgi:hypothetical protein